MEIPLRVEADGDINVRKTEGCSMTFQGRVKVDEFAKFSNNKDFYQVHNILLYQGSVV